MRTMIRWKRKSIPKSTNISNLSKKITLMFSLSESNSLKLNLQTFTASKMTLSLMSTSGSRKASFQVKMIQKWLLTTTFKALFMILKTEMCSTTLAVSTVTSVSLRQCITCLKLISKT